MVGLTVILFGLLANFLLSAPISIKGETKATIQVEKESNSTVEVRVVDRGNMKK